MISKQINYEHKGAEHAEHITDTPWIQEKQKDLKIITSLEKKKKKTATSSYPFIKSLQK